MKLVLERLHAGERGMNGQILLDNTHICFTIERPWLDNQRRVSCIPASTYILEKRFSKKFGWHLILKGVPNRDLILIHPANDAMKELNGCIAPVTSHTGIGKGSDSKKAFQKLLAIVYAIIEKEIVTLQINDKYQTTTIDTSSAIFRSNSDSSTSKTISPDSNQHP